MKLIEITFFVVRERKDKERHSCPGLNGEETFPKLTIFLLTFYFFFHEQSGILQPPTNVYKCIQMIQLRCFDTVFQRANRYFSKALKVLFSLSDRYIIFTSNWLWIEICENVVLSKIDITMTTTKKNFETDKSRILCDLDLLLRIQH